MASEHARGAAGATHVLRDGDEADADERAGGSGGRAGEIGRGTDVTSKPFIQCKARKRRPTLKSKACILAICNKKTKAKERE